MAGPVRHTLGMQGNPDSSDSPQDSQQGPENHAHPVHDLGQRLLDAAIQAEYETGAEEQSEAEARKHVAIRIARMIGEEATAKAEAQMAEMKRRNAEENERWARDQ